jgi:autotransporter-associated beta strand protein
MGVPYRIPAPHLLQIQNKPTHDSIMKKKTHQLFSAPHDLCKAWTRSGLKAGRRASTTMIAASLSVIALSASHAASLTWNGGSGNWDLSTANWSGPVAWSQTSTTSPLHDAVFGGVDGSYTITIASGQQMAANFLTFNSSGYTITGGTLYLATGTPVTTVAANKTATINSAIATTNNAILNMTVNSGGILNLGGGFTVSPQGRFSGTGTINITAGTYGLNVPQFNNAATNQSGGTVNMAGSTTAGNFIGYNAGRNTAYTISGGSLNLNGTDGAYLAIGRAQVTYTSTLTVKDSGLVNIGTTSSGRINIVSNDGDSNGVLDVQGGTLTVGTGNASNRIYLFGSGANASKTSTFKQSGGTVTAQGIQFGGGGTTTYAATALAKLELTGGSLYVGSLGITRGSAAASLPVSILLNGGTLGASATWSSSLDMNLGGAVIQAADSTATARDITLSGALTSSTGFSKTGGGVLSLSGANNISGAIGINAGTLAVESAGALTGGGNITFGGGTLRFSANNTSDYSSRIVNSSSAVAIGTNGQNVTFASALASSNVGGLTKHGTGTLTLTAANAYTGTTTINAGTLAIGNGGSIGNTSSGVVVSGASSALSIGNGGTVNASGVMNLNGGGTIYVETGGAFNATALASGTVTQKAVSFRPDGSGATPTSGKLASSGAAGTGGTFTVTGEYLRPSGVNNSNHTFTFDNANVSATASTFEVGRGGSANTTTLSNGTQMNVKNVTVMIDAGNYTLNVESGSGMTLQNNTFNLRAGASGNGIATVNINGGTVSGVSTFSFNGATDSAVTISNGGELAATNVSVSNGTTGTNTLTFDDGKLTARANSATLLSGTGTVKIRSGGATIDSGAYSVTVSSALTEDATSTGGGLTKTGAGTLTLTGENSYTGDTTVSQGVLAVSGNSIPDSNELVIAGGKVNLATVSNNETVNTLVFGTSPQAAGTYGSTSSTATFKDDTRFSGSGVLTVLSGTAPAGFASWIAGTFTNGTVPAGQQGENDDPDNDGISNLLEYAIDGQDPTVANSSAGSLSGKTLSYSKRPGTSGLIYAIEDSTDLGINDPWQEVPAGPAYANNETTISYTMPAGPAKNFIRLKVSN